MYFRHPFERRCSLGVFILNEKKCYDLAYPVKTRLSFLFLCIVVNQIFTIKLNLWPDIGLTCKISIVNCFFLKKKTNTIIRKYF